MKEQTVRWMVALILCCMGMGTSGSLCAKVEAEEVKKAPVKELIIKGDRAFPPYEFINDQGEADGFNVELMRAIMDKIGMPYQLSLDSWPQVLAEYKEGKVDLLTGIMYSNSRAQLFKFGAIHSMVYLNVVYRKGRAPISKLEELKGLRVIVQKGAITQELLEEEMPQAHLVLVSDLSEGFRLLSEGEYDVAMCNQEMAQSIIYKSGFSNLDMSELDLPPEEFCFASNSDSLMTVIDNAFYQLQRSGEYERIHNKWFSMSVHRGIPLWLYWLVVALALALVIGYLFILLLRRQVKKANKEAKQENLKLSLAIKGSNIVFWELDTVSQMYRTYNDPVNGYDGTRLIPLSEYHRHMGKSSQMDPYIALMMEGRDESYSIDLSVTLPDAEDYTYFTVTGIPFEKDPLTGRVVKYVGFRRDNTEIVKLNKELGESAQKMRYVFNHSGILMWDYYLDTRMMKLDNGDENSLQWLTEDELLEKRIVPAGRGEARRFLKGLAEGKESNFTVQWELLPAEDAPNQDTRYTIINGMPIRDVTGKVIAYSGLRRDVTDLIRTQQKLEHETERALQSDKLKSAFLANMSHEIRTPLNAIVGFSGLLQDSDDAAERAGYIQIINTNNELLLNLINDILDLSKIESGEVALLNEYFDLAPYFDSLAASLQQRLVNPDVQFVAENPYAECTVFMDRSRLAQICTNFTTNAIKHTSKGLIKIGYAYVDGGIRLYAEDTGHGIPAGKQHLVFQRFEKLNPFVQGTGLGLSICKAIVDAYNGKIGFTSQEGKGSVFWAWLPCEAKIVDKES